MDTPNLQYYDPMTPQAPEPWWKKRHFLMTAGVITGSVVVFAFLVVFIVNSVFLNRDAGGRVNKMEQAKAIAEQMAAECDPGDSRCLEQATADAARQVGTTGACEDLTGEALASCVSLIAIDAANPELCGPLSGEEKKECEDSANLLLAKQTNDGARCASLHSSVLRVSCEQQLADTAESIQLAVATGDVGSCEALSVEDEATCRDILFGTDEDRDGVNAAQEFELGLSDIIADADADGLNDGDEIDVHKTDPKNPDTDADGFPDGIEVDTGYDPLK